MDAKLGDQGGVGPATWQWSDAFPGATWLAGRHAATERSPS
jgi:hypothetical protein